MKLGLLSNDSDLYDQIINKSIFEEVVFADDIDEALVNDVVIISDMKVPHNYLSAKLNTFGKKHVFYMLSNQYENNVLNNIISICQAHNVELIPPKLTLGQIVEKITKTIFPDSNNRTKNVVTFIGADSKVGRKMVVQSTAEILSRRTNAKIGLLFLNGTPGTCYMKTKEFVSLDDFKIKIENKILTGNELIDSSIKINNLYIIPGVRNLLGVRHYKPEDIEFLIELAAQEFDVVLIDAGHNLDSPMAYKSLNMANYVYLITTQQDNVRKKFEKVETQILNQLIALNEIQIRPNEFFIVVNKYLDNNSIYTANQIADIYKMMLATYIPHLEFLGWQAEFEQKTLLNYENEEYNTQIEQLAKLISKQMKVDYTEPIKKKKKILSLFSF